MKSILKATEKYNKEKRKHLYMSVPLVWKNSKSQLSVHMACLCIQIFYCTAGSGELVVNEERYCIEAGNGFS